MFGFIKNLLRRSPEIPDESAQLAAPEPPPVAAQEFSSERPRFPKPPLRQTPGHQNFSPQHSPHSNGKGIELSVQKILGGLPLELQGRVRQTDVGELTLSVPLEKILAQLSRGSVKISFGELRQALPDLFTPENDRDRVLVPLPLDDILARLNPALITRRRVQRHIEVPAEISSPFDLDNRGLIIAVGPTKPAEPPSPVRHSGLPPASPAGPSRQNLTFVPKPPAPPAPPSLPSGMPARPTFTQAPKAAPPPPPAPVAPARPAPIAMPPPASSPPFAMPQFVGPSPAAPLAAKPAVPPARPAAPAAKPTAPTPVRPAAPAPTFVPRPPAPPPNTAARAFGQPGAPQTAPAPAPAPVRKPTAPPPTFTPRPPAPAPNTPALSFGEAEVQEPSFAAAEAQQPTATPAAAAQPAKAASDAPPLIVSLTSLAEGWPEAVRKEIVDLNLVDAKVALPGDAVEQALRMGRLAFSWGTLRSWLKPSVLASASDSDAVVLELPLKIVAPLFLARQRDQAATRQKVAVNEDIPNLFFGFPQAEPVGAPPVAVATARPSDTNFYVWNDSSDMVNVHESETKRGSSPGTRFVAKYATPNEVVSRAAALDGVAGALIALPDGLMVASRLSTDLNGDTLAAFLPQIFGKVSQCTKELRMGELNNLNFTVGNVPWKIFRVNAIFFAAFGRAGEPLPTAQLAAMAAELDHTPK